MTRKNIRVLEITRYGMRVLDMTPEHPEFEAMCKRDFEAGVALDRLTFQMTSVRSLLMTLFKIC